MKKRMKELMAFLLVICMAFGSVGTTGYAAADTGETGTENVDGEGPAPGEESVPGQEDGGAPGEPEPQASAEPEEGETGETEYVVYNCNYPDETAGQEKKVELPAEGTFKIGDGSERTDAEGYIFTGWYGYSEIDPYEEGTEINVEEFKSKYGEGYSDEFPLTAGWSQKITVTVDGEETDPCKAGDTIDRPSKTLEGYELVKWTLNDIDLSADKITPGYATESYITKLVSNTYNITADSPRAAFVSYWRPSKGYLIKIQNNTGKNLQIGETLIEAGITTTDPAGIYTTLDGQYSSDKTYVVQTEELSVDGLTPEYVTYQGNMVECYTIELKEENLERCVEMVYSTVEADVSFSGNNVELTVVSESTTIQDLQAQSAVTASRPGYTFMGWSYSTGDGETLEETAALPGDCAQIICTPVWGGTVTFHSNYPDENFPMDNPAEIKRETGMAVDVPAMADDYGKYRFLGWAASRDASAAQYTESYTVTGDADLYGVWTAQEYTLTWKDIESTEYRRVAGNYTENTYGSETVPYGSPIETPEDPVKPGYVFLGWDGYNNGTGVEGTDPLKTYSSGNPFPDKTFMPARDAQIVATWEPVIYSVVYDGNGADLGVPEAPEASCYYGDEIKLPTLIPSRSGYTFAGWEYGGTVYPAGGTFTIPEAEYNEDHHAQLTLTAAWTPNRHTVSYDGAGATSGVPGSHEAEYNSSVTAAAGPVRDGYVFDGWEQISTGDRISAGVAFIMPDMDETLRAMWKIAWSRFGGPGTYYLVGGQEYGLDFKAGVEGDEGQYESGISFYVPVSGYYTFTE